MHIHKKGGLREWLSQQSAFGTSMSVDLWHTRKKPLCLVDLSADTAETGGFLGLRNQQTPGSLSQGLKARQTTPEKQNLPLTSDLHTPTQTWTCTHEHV